MMRTLAHHLRFMTLSKADLESITPALQKFMIEKEFKAVRFAVESGDSSKLPNRYSTSNERRMKPPCDQPIKPPADENEDRSEHLFLTRNHNSRHEENCGLPQVDSKTHFKEEDTKVKKENFAGETSLDHVQIKLELVLDEQRKELKAKKLKTPKIDAFKNDEQFPTEVKAAEKKPDQEWETEITDKIYRVTKKRIQVKEEEDQASEAGDEQENVPAKKRRLSDQEAEPESDQQWEFIETNGSMQVRRKHTKPQEVLMNETAEDTRADLKEGSVQRPAARETFLVHFELQQDNFQLTKTVHQVQSVAEKVIFNVKVLKDLQLLGLEFSARTEKLSNKYKKSRYE